MKNVFLMAAVAVMIAMTGCGEKPVTYQTLDSVTVSPKSVTIAVGEKVALEAILKWSEDGDAIGWTRAYGLLLWESSDEAVASVTYDDLLGFYGCEVTGVAPGTVTITYSAYDTVAAEVKTDTCEVTVTAAE
jgi:uncharacterized protein YjdB